MRTIPLEIMVVFFSFVLKYPSNGTVKGTIMETAMPPNTFVSGMSPSFVATYTELTEILRMIEADEDEVN